MLLLIREIALLWDNVKVHLQYTLLLLIQTEHENKIIIYYRFTIHFATINTFQTNLLEDVFLHLQYTLLLLIPLIKISAPEISKFTIHFATINTYSL